MEPGQVEAAETLLRKLEATVAENERRAERVRITKLYNALPEVLKIQVRSLDMVKRRKPGRSKAAKQHHADMVALYTANIEMLLAEQPNPELARLHITYAP